MTLRRDDLTVRLVDGLRAANCTVALETLPEERPLLLGLGGTFGRLSLRAFIWNITLGGPAGVRDADEYRVQTTRPAGVRFLVEGGPTTVLLGFHEALGVFAAWDVRAHPNPGSSSSLQVSLSTLEEAADEGFASQTRRLANASEEIVFSFRPERADAYFGSLSNILQGDPSSVEVRALDQAGSGEELDIEELPEDVERQVAIREVAVRVRDARFRTRVVAAYGGRCAFCGLGVGLVDAAHVVGVANGGPDLIVNGVAACPTHHRAFDRGFMTVDPDMTISVSLNRLSDLGVAADEVNFFGDGMRRRLLLPADATLHPLEDFLAWHRARWM